MFSVLYREQVREAIIKKANEDKRISSAAVIGSYAKGAVDKFSDIDLTFGVDENYLINELLDTWTEFIFNEFRGKEIFTLLVDNTTYRVYLLPGCLQVDLSFSHSKNFGSINDNFILLYGQAFTKKKKEPQPIKETFGYLLHHLLRARFCLERNRLWQSEFWINESKNYVLKLACIANNLDSDYGRNIDDLPLDFLKKIESTIICNFSKEELIKALNALIIIIPTIAEPIKSLFDEFEFIFSDLISLTNE